MSFLDFAESWFGNVFGNIASSVESVFGNAFSWITGGLGDSVQNFVQTIQNLPSEIANFFTSLGGAIMNGLMAFGHYIWNGLQTVAQGLASMFTPVERAITGFASTLFNALSSFGSSLWSAISGGINWIIQHVQNAISYLYSLATNAWNFIASGVNAVYNFIMNSVNTVESALKTIVNFFFDMPNFFGNILSYFENLLTANNPVTQIPNLIASEVSRIAYSFTDVIGFNIFMETLPKLVNGLANFGIYGGSWKSILGKALLLIGSPLISGIMGILGKAILSSFFANTTTQSVQPRPKPATSYAPSNLPSVSMQPSTIQGTQTLPQTTAPTNPQPPSLSQFQAQLTSPTTTSAYIEDVITIGTGNVNVHSGFVNFLNSVKEFYDSIVVTASMIMRQLKSAVSNLTTTYGSELYVVALENILQIPKTITVSAVDQATAFNLPFGMGICNTNCANYQGTGTSEICGQSSASFNYTTCVNSQTTNSTVSTNPPQAELETTVPVGYGACIPPNNLVVDNISIHYTALNSITPDIQDTINQQYSASLGIPTQPNLSDQINQQYNAVVGLPTKPNIQDQMGIQYNAMTGLPIQPNLQDSISVNYSTNFVQPQTETINVTTAPNTTTQYEIDVLYAGSINASLSWNVTFTLA